MHSNCPFIVEEEIHNAAEAIEQSFKDSVGNAGRGQNVYRAASEELDHHPFYESWEEEMRKAAERYRQPEAVSDSEHCQIIGGIADRLSAKFADLLDSGRFRYGVSQKGLNMYLKIPEVLVAPRRDSRSASLSLRPQCFGGSGHPRAVDESRQRTGLYTLGQRGSRKSRGGFPFRVGMQYLVGIQASARSSGQTPSIDVQRKIADWRNNRLSLLGWACRRPYGARRQSQDPRNEVDHSRQRCHRQGRLGRAEWMALA